MNKYDKKLSSLLKTEKAKYILWHTGSKGQAEYIERYSEFLKGNSVIVPLPDYILKGGSDLLSKKFLEYFFLDFPDVIISKKSEFNELPILGIEILEQKPVGWNQTQRFSRGAASLILGVPFVYLIPQRRYMFDKYKGKKPRKSLVKIGGDFYKENLRKEYQLPFSIYKLSMAHNIPCLAFFWPIEEEYKYLSEGLVYNQAPEFKCQQLPPPPQEKEGEAYPEIQRLFQFVDLVLSSYEENTPPSLLMKDSLVRDNLSRIDPDKTTLYSLKHVSLKDPDGGNIKIATRLKTGKVIRKIKNLQALKGDYIHSLFSSPAFQFFKQRPETIVVTTRADPAKGNRGFADPYSGVVSSFDYRYCRKTKGGDSITSRERNLVFMPSHPNSTTFFNSILKSSFPSGIIIEWGGRSEAEETFQITRKIFSEDFLSLRKELKTFFYFCDLIVPPGNLFVGRSFVD